MLPSTSAALRWTQVACRRAKGCRVLVRIGHYVKLQYWNRHCVEGNRALIILQLHHVLVSKTEHWTIWIWSRSHRAIPEICFVCSVCVLLNWLLWRKKGVIPKGLFPEYPSQVAGSCGSQQSLLSDFSSVPSVLILAGTMWPSSPASSMSQASHSRLSAEPLFTHNVSVEDKHIAFRDS